jgi:hypothetical protein
MMFGTGILLAGGTTILMAILDKTFEEFGVHWVSTTLKIALPLAGMILGVYFLQTNPIIGWLK